MRVALVVLILLLSSTLLIADEHSVNFDNNTDFSKLKTFAFRQAKSDSALPEFNNPLYLKNFKDVIRAALVAKGMKEVTDRPDLLVDFRFDGRELNHGDTPGQRIGQGHPGYLYAEGTLKIDLFARERNLLVWEGIYRDFEDNPSRLARKYKVDATSLLAQYPPKKK